MHLFVSFVLFIAVFQSPANSTNRWFLLFRSIHSQRTAGFALDKYLLVIFLQIMYNLW